ncbi:MULTISPECIES: class I SAM-dependent methyltransferase [unclassified Anabaena]|uniref:class I SAM-dependent methyltransferase n=1 Tax=unclassified Anabaena TaxID=2619674 RepID=UPI00082D2899|nr:MULTISPECIES: class I SAM-dependent methyltransferase [unclassified Anabaena]
MNIFEKTRIRQLQESQDRLIKRFLFEQDYAKNMAVHPLHACIGDWIELGQSNQVLELGCGPGKYVALLSTLGFNVVGVDPLVFPSWEMIRENTSATLLDSVYAENLPFSSEYFDHAVCLGALLYFESPEKALSELKRVVKPGGKIIIRTVNKNNLYTLNTGKKLDPASKNLYSMPDLIQLIENSGMIVEKNFSFGFWPPLLTDLWWYLLSVYISPSLQVQLSNLLKPENRINNILFATVPFD